MILNVIDLPRLIPISIWMLAIVIKLPCSFLNLVIKTIISLVARRPIRTTVARHCIVLIFKWPVIPPDQTLLLNQDKKHLRVNVIFLRHIINNLRSTHHASRSNTLRFIQSFMSFRILIEFINTNIWRIVILRIAICLSHSLSILRPSRTGRNPGAVRILSTRDQSRTPHIASWRLLVKKALDFFNRHRIWVIKNRIVNQVACIKICWLNRLCLWRTRYGKPIKHSAKHHRSKN